MKSKKKKKIKIGSLAKPMYKKGAKVEGAPHEMEGVEVEQQSSNFDDEMGGGQEQPNPEVEGGERIFSVEDTAKLEEMAANVIQLSQQNQQAADEAAKQLGYAVVSMVQQQEGSQAQQAENQESAFADTANSFENYES